MERDHPRQPTPAANPFGAAHQVEVIRPVIVACQCGDVARIGIRIDGYIRKYERCFECQFGVGIYDIAFSRLDGLCGSKIDLCCIAP